MFGFSFYLVILKYTLGIHIVVEYLEEKEEELIIS